MLTVALLIVAGVCAAATDQERLKSVFVPSGRYAARRESAEKERQQQRDADRQHYLDDVRDVIQQHLEFERWHQQLERWAKQRPGNR